MSLNYCKNRFFIKRSASPALQPVEPVKPVELAGEALRKDGGALSAQGLDDADIDAAVVPCLKFRFVCRLVARIVAPSFFGPCSLHDGAEQEHHD